MHNYDELKKTHGCRISQTLDSPIMFVDLWELSDVLWSLVAILIFGLLFYSWWLLIASLIWILGIAPFIKRNTNKGYFLHWPYKKWGMNLPGLINPGANKRYSD